MDNPNSITYQIQDENVRIHQQSASVGLWIPAGQAVITGFFIGLVVAITSIALHFERWYLWGFLAWVMAQVIVWVILLTNWHKLVNRLEKFTGFDIDGDGDIADIPAPPPLRVDITEDDGRSVRFAYLPAPSDKLQKMASMILSGSNFSESFFVGSGKLFTRSQFAELRGVMLKRGLLEWNNPSSPARGVVFTKTGLAVIRHLSKMAPPPSE